MEDLVYDDHKKSCNTSFAEIISFTCNSLKTFFLTCPSKISALCVFYSCYMTYMTRENLDLFAPYLNMDIRTKQVYIKRDSVHHLLDLQNVTKVTLKYMSCLLGILQKLHFDQNLYLFKTQCKNIT